MEISDSTSSPGGIPMLWWVTSLMVTRIVSFARFCMLYRKSGGHHRWLYVKREKFCLFLMLTEWRKTKKIQSYTICVCSVIQSCCNSVTPWTLAHQAPLSMGILQARILKWIAISFSLGFIQPRDQPRSPSLQADSLPSEPPGKPIFSIAIVVRVCMGSVSFSHY